jgi:hypothetical protein
MFMLISVPLAFFTADTASSRTGMEHAADHFFVGSGAPRRDPTGDIADVGAVEVKTYALTKRGNHVLSQTCICTGSASLRTRVTVLNASNERIIYAAPNVRMRTNHLLYMHERAHFLIDASLRKILVHTKVPPVVGASRVTFL